MKEGILGIYQHLVVISVFGNTVSKGINLLRQGICSMGERRRSQNVKEGDGGGGTGQEETMMAMRWRPYNTYIHIHIIL